MYNSYEPYQPETRFSVFPPAIKNLIIINGLAFMAMNTPFFDTLIARWFYLWPPSSGYFEWHQLGTYLFLHGSFSHLFFNLFALWMFGVSLENQWGTRKFLLYYFLTGFGAGLLQLFLSWSNGPVIGASGSVYGILLAFGMTYPNRIIMLLFPPIPMKAKYLVVGYGIIELISGITSLSSGIAHFAHLGGMIAGFVIIKIWQKTGLHRPMDY